MTSRARPPSRPTRSLERARSLCPSEHEADRIADTMSEIGLRVFLQRLVAGFVDSACRTSELYDAKVAEARRANAKLHCEERDEDLPGVAGFDSRAQRTREFAAQLAMQATALLAAAEGAVQAFEQLTGDS